MKVQEGCEINLRFITEKEERKADYLFSLNSTRLLFPYARKNRSQKRTCTEVIEDTFTSLKYYSNELKLDIMKS